MNLSSLQHLVRSVGSLVDAREVIVLGSASLLAFFPELGDEKEPLAATYDADICPASGHRDGDGRHLCLTGIPCDLAGNTDGCRVLSS